MFTKTFVSLIVAATAALAVASPSQAADEAAFAGPESSRLMIVNGNTDQVIYDDGRDDLFCVTRRHVVGYTIYGAPIHRRTMRCR